MGDLSGPEELAAPSHDAADTEVRSAKSGTQKNFGVTPLCRA
jgi:hypothetical protein